jgi:hypothetical protein
MDIDFLNPNPSTTHEVRFDPWAGGDVSVAIIGGTPNVPASDEKSTYLEITVNSGANWGGCGFQLTNNDRTTGGTNLTRFTNGYIIFDLKMESSSPNFQITIENGTYPNVDTSVAVGIGSGSYGEAKDGQWHKIVIPISNFFNSSYDATKLGHVASPFQIRATGGGGNKFYIDRIYWAR